jgi:transcriptional regulator with XRE-family HTH domain
MTTARRRNEYVPEQSHATLTPAESLKITRELQGLSQSELSRQSGVPQSAISAFESGQEEMGLKRIKVLAAALKVHPSVIAFPNWQAEVIDLYAHLRARATREQTVQKSVRVGKAGRRRTSKAAASKAAKGSRRAKR